MKGEDLVVLALFGVRAGSRVAPADSARRSVGARLGGSALLALGLLGGEGALELALAGHGGADGEVDVEEHGVFLS